MILDFQQAFLDDQFLAYPDWQFGSLPAGTSQTEGQGNIIVDTEQIEAGPGSNVANVTGSTDFDQGGAGW